MTDNEIIKALSCCSNVPYCPTDCPLIENDRDCLLALQKPMLDFINRQKAEIERLTIQRDKAIKDFTEFAQTAFENPFACNYCKYSVRDSRACLWKAEHEEACMSRYFEYKEMVGDSK